MGWAALASVVAELQRHAEIGFPEQAHHFLELVPRRGCDAKLIALDARLDLLELAVLEELDDVARLVRRDPLLQRDLLPHRRIPGLGDGAAGEVAHGNV